MSTEYTILRTCQQSGERSSLHLGLSTGHRRFQFRAHPTLNLVSFDSIVEFIERDGAEVVDEYGRHVSLDEFIDFAQASLKATTLRPHERENIRFNGKDVDQRHWVDDAGHSFANYEFF